MSFMARFPDLVPGYAPEVGAAMAFDGFYADKHTFKSRIYEFQEGTTQETVPRGGIMAQATVRTHLPTVNVETLLESRKCLVPERLAAELSWRGILSEQKPDIHRLKTNYYELRQKIARKQGITSRKLLKQWERLPVKDRPDYYMPSSLSFGLLQTNEPATFQSGIEQRIRFGTYLENLQEVQETEGYGLALYQALCRTAQWDPERKQVLEDVDIARYKMAFQKRRAERSEALSAMSLNRAEPEFRNFFSMKNQWKLKEKVHQEAKPAQPIFVRGDEYLYNFGWVGMYLLDQILAELPKWIYIHAKKSIEDAKDWFLNWTSGFVNHEALDMSGLDGTVRGGAVNLMSLLMQRYDVPPEIVQLYVEDKCSFEVREKVLGLATMSGEIFTYLINTMFCLARECLKYDLPAFTPIAQSGDDTYREADMPINENWRLWEHLDWCVEKRGVSDVGEFVSFKVKNGILYKDPVILLSRLLGQIERGKIDEIALGYFELFSHNYMLKDQLYEIMNEEELECQQMINDIMFHWRKQGGTTKLPWNKLVVLPVGAESDAELTVESVEAASQLSAARVDGSLAFSVEKAISDYVVARATETETAFRALSTAIQILAE